MGLDWWVKGHFVEGYTWCRGGLQSDVRFAGEMERGKQSDRIREERRWSQNYGRETRTCLSTKWTKASFQTETSLKPFRWAEGALIVAKSEQSPVEEVAHLNSLRGLGLLAHICAGRPWYRIKKSWEISLDGSKICHGYYSFRRRVPEREGAEGAGVAEIVCVLHDHMRHWSISLTAKG